MQIVTIELSHVGVTYQIGQANSVSALGGINLCIGQGEFVFLVGPTGAGKLTLLKLLYHDVRPTAGTIKVGDFDLARLRPRDVPQLRRQMGIVL